MLDDSVVARVAEEAVHAAGAGAGLERVIAKPTVDSVGEDAIQLTLVLTPEGAEQLTGDQVVDLVSEVHQRLLASGEERLPIVRYATEDDLVAEAAEFQAEWGEDEGVGPQP